MIRTRSLSYKYHSEKEIAFGDLNIASGDQFLLLGESGSGKTTLLHLLGGLLKNQQGTIEVNGISISTLSEGELDRFRGKHYGFIFQRNHLLAALTVEQNLLMAPYLAGLNQNKNRVEEVLVQLGIADKKKKRIQELSLGQAQRVAIARAVLNKPSVILADEPTSALDDRSCDRVSELLISVAKQNQATLIIATHDQRLKNRIHNLIQL
ncbi:MAG TPA: ATP-binding cassette domain-containing protein [Cyclobacteriaceae bacterium]|nr:ATP-binding cassette domain-containing protein [Cyclobacteriaceae bacterium]